MLRFVVELCRSCPKRISRQRFKAREISSSVRAARTCARPAEKIPCANLNTRQRRSHRSNYSTASCFGYARVSYNEKRSLSRNSTRVSHPPHLKANGRLHLFLSLIGRAIPTGASRLSRSFSLRPNFFVSGRDTFGSD